MVRGNLRTFAAVCGGLQAIDIEPPTPARPAISTCLKNPWIFSSQALIACVRLLENARRTATPPTGPEIHVAPPERARPTFRAARFPLAPVIAPRGACDLEKALPPFF